MADFIGEQVEIELVAPAFEIHRTPHFYTGAVPITGGFLLTALLADIHLDSVPATRRRNLYPERKHQKFFLFFILANRRIAADNAAYRNITFNHLFFVFNDTWIIRTSDTWVD